MFTFSIFDQKYSFWANLVQEMQHSMVMLTFFVFDRKHSFRVNVLEKIWQWRLHLLLQLLLIATTTGIDHVFTNATVENIEINAAIVKRYICNHFPIIFATKTKTDVKISEQYIFKRNFPYQSIDRFQQNWSNYRLEQYQNFTKCQWYI